MPRFRTTILGLTAALMTFAMTNAAMAASDEKADGVYELRTYTTAPGKLPVLVERFGKSNLPLFERHGIKLEGAWTPAKPDDQGDRLVYLVWFPSREAAKQAWAGFSNDPEWKDVFGQEKETHGQVVTRVENVLLAPTDYTPHAEIDQSAEGRLFELRTYIASPDRLDKLNTRFRDHTLKLFEKHGMANVLYMVPTDAEKGAENTLVYFLAHKNDEAARASWDGFRNDAEWNKVRSESEADGVKLAEKVVSVYLVPTAFSPLR